ncbi:MAG: response regulator transcription factor [Candidatus Limnocylindrales bacterium]
MPGDRGAAGSAGTEEHRILLVEDDEPLVAILVRHLAAHGIETVVAASVEAAVEMLRNGSRPALILLDINLPDDTGWALLRSGAYADAGSPPVVVVSATRIPGSHLRDFGISGYLPKPFAIDTLVETVRRYAGRADESSARNHPQTWDMEV